MKKTSTCQQCLALFLPVSGTKGLYCSRSCFNVSNAVASANRNKQKHLAAQEAYNYNPILCKSCHATLSYANRKGKFCNRSCSATYTNSQRGPRPETTKDKISKSLAGRKLSCEILKKRSESRKLITTKCIICNQDTNTRHRKTCSTVCYRRLSTMNSQRNPNCGGQKHTHRAKVANINGDVFVSESSFEVKVANSLNHHNVLWYRPKFFWYTDDTGTKRRYYPDFYLPGYDVYLDPKNDHLIRTDIDKIARTSAENRIRILVLSENQLDWFSVKELVDLR